MSPLADPHHMTEIAVFAYHLDAACATLYETLLHTGIVSKVCFVKVKNLLRGGVSSTPATNSSKTH